LQSTLSSRIWPQKKKRMESDLRNLGEKNHVKKTVLEKLRENDYFNSTDIACRFRARSIASRLPVP